MKIGLQTWGTHGDIRPFIALSEGLHNSGHEVTLVITCIDSDRYNNLKDKKGLKYIVVGSPIVPDNATLYNLGNTIFSKKNSLLQFDIMVKHMFLPAEKAMYDASIQLCQDNDLIIAHSILYPMKIAAESFKKPFIFLYFAHCWTATAKHPPLGLPNFGAFSNRLFWKLGETLHDKTFRKYPNALKKSNNLSVDNDSAKNRWTSPYLNIVAVSETIFERPVDWPVSFRISGNLDIPNIEIEGKLSDDLNLFLESGDQPVYFTLGSMMPPSVEAQRILVNKFIEVAKKSGSRAIIQLSSLEQCEFKSTSEIYFLKNAPHKIIFPKCKLIIHHGGAGTTHTISRLGIPSIVLYCMLEQQFWGIQLSKLGVSPGYLSVNKINLNKLAKMIKSINTNADYKNNAVSLANKMQNENGVQKFIDIINTEFNL